MPTSDELRSFLQERLRAMDPTLRLDPSSPASVQVVEPTVRRFEPDPLDTNLELFVRTRLAQEYPEMQSGEGSAIADLLVKPLRILLEPFVREIKSIKRNQSLIDPSVLNRDEADALMGNIFVSREIGDYAKVTGRVYFANPLSVNIGSSNVLYTASNLRFLPTMAQSITAEGMLFNQSGDLYYMDVSCVAESPGKAYNIPADALVGITNLTAAAKVTNLRAAEGGVDEETTLQMISRGEQSIGERSLTTVPGIVSRLFEQFTGMKVLNVIGFNDEEMQRDVITGGNLGDPEIWCADGDASDDGSGTGYTPYLDSAGSDFTAQFGPVGTSLENYVLTVWWSSEPHDFELEEVIGATRVAVSSDYSTTERLPHASIGGTNQWVIRKRTLTLSGIPGGILFPTTGGTTVDVEPDEVHVGGCVDFLVSGDGNEDETVGVEIIGTNNPIDMEGGGSIDGGVRRRNADTNGAAGTEKNKITLNDVTSEDYALITDEVTSIRLLSGSDEGTYRIIRSSFLTDTATLYVDRDLSASETSLLCALFDDIEVKLTDIQETILTGTELRTYAGNADVDTSSGLTWADFGVAAEQYLEILNGVDEGIYKIDTVSGGTLTLESNLRNTASPLNFRVYASQDENVELPLLRVKSVELLNSSMEPTGSFVPFRDPIDARSTSFQNPGRGAKAGTDVIVTENSYMARHASSKDVIYAVDSGGTPKSSFDFYALGIRVGDVVNLNSSDNQGYYKVESVGGDPASLLTNSYELQISEELDWLVTDMLYEVGEVSHGEFRIYFKEPCEFSITYDDSFISVTLDDGTVRRFRPDPDIRDEFLPTDTTTPAFTMVDDSASVDLYASGGATVVNPEKHFVQVGDRAEITYAPIVGSLDLQAGGIDLDGKNILIDLGSGNERIYFQGTSLSISEIISQINTQASRSIATKYTVSGAPDEEYLMLRSDSEITLKLNADSNDCTQTIFGTTRATYMPWETGNFNSSDTSNDSHMKGYWFVTALTEDSVTLENSAGTAFDPDHTISDTQLTHFVKFSRAGKQRISATDMNSNVDDLGFYYFDVECISEGYGDVWNIDPDLRGVVTGYSSEGWTIYSTDSNMTFSMAEEPWLRVSPRVIFVGVEDDPSNYEELTGRNFQITYERSPLVENTHSFVRDVQERVVCSSPLARHLLPIYVRVKMSYYNGPTDSDAKEYIIGVIEAVYPEQQLEVSDLVAKLTDNGATYVALPVEVVGIGHQTDRSIIVQRSKDIITPGRLSVLIPDDDGTTSEGASYIMMERTTA